MSQPRYAGFTLRTECNHCGMPLPVEGPAQIIECGQCHGQVVLTDTLWREVLYTFEGDNPPPPGKMLTHNVTVGSFPLQIQVASIAPACEKCGTAFPVNDLPAQSSYNFRCVGCGDPACSLPAPPWLQAQVRTAQQLYTVDPRSFGPQGAETAAVDVEATRPVVMSCPQCGGSLSITSEDARVTSCQYCRAEVFLPDEVWRRLHPVRTVRWWYVRFEGLTPEKATAHQEATETQALQETQRKIARERAARAWKQVPNAWRGVFVLLAMHAFLYANYFQALTIPPLLSSDRLVMLWVGVGVGVFLVGLIGIPMATAEGSRWGFLATMAAAAFCLVPFAGGLFGILGGAFFMRSKPTPDKPAAGVGRPACAAFIIHGASTISALIFSMAA